MLHLVVAKHRRRQYPEAGCRVPAPPSLGSRTSLSKGFQFSISAIPRKGCCCYEGGKCSTSCTTYHCKAWHGQGFLWWGSKEGEEQEPEPDTHLQGPWLVPQTVLPRQSRIFWQLIITLFWKLTQF